jgi:hypothetical protein
MSEAHITLALICLIAGAALLRAAYRLGWADAREAEQRRRILLLIDKQQKRGPT